MIKRLIRKLRNFFFNSNKQEIKETASDLKFFSIGDIFTNTKFYINKKAIKKILKKMELSENNKYYKMNNIYYDKKILNQIIDFSIISLKIFELKDIQDCINKKITEFMEIQGYELTSSHIIDFLSIKLNEDKGLRFNTNSNRYFIDIYSENEKKTIEY